MTDPKATHLEQLTHLQVIERGLKVMDATAITLCMDNKLPLIVFNLTQAGNLKSIVQGKKIGTLVTQNLAQA